MDIWHCYFSLMSQLPLPISPSATSDLAISDRWQTAHQSTFRPSQPEGIVSLPYNLTCLYTHLFCLGFLPANVLLAEGSHFRKDGKKNIYIFLWWKLPRWINYNTFSFVLSWKYIKKWKQSQCYIIICECCLGKSYFPVTFPYAYLFGLVWFSLVCLFGWFSLT